MCFARASATRLACSLRLCDKAERTLEREKISMLTLLRLNEAIAMLYAFHKMEGVTYSIA